MGPPEAEGKSKESRQAQSPALGYFYNMNRESTLVLDLETKKAARAREEHYNLGIAVVGVYDYLTDEFSAFEEHEIAKLEDLIASRSLIVGFNIIDFDYQVLQPYLKSVRLEDIPTLDIIEEVRKIAGFRVALNNLAKHTLGEEKIGHGLEAVEWFNQGRVEDVKRYCLDDVRLTRDLYEYGKREGLVRFESRERGVVAVPAGWARLAQEREVIRDVLEEANKSNLVVEIDYVSSSPEAGEEARKRRVIEVRAIHGATIEAYCYLRQDVRNFRLSRILGADIKEGAPATRPTLF